MKTNTSALKDFIIMYFFSELEAVLKVTTDYRLETSWTYCMYKFNLSLQKSYNPLEMTNATNCALVKGKSVKGKNSERWSVAKRLNNASGHRLCLSILLSL